MFRYPIEPFGPRHNREAFSCGNKELDRYFRERVRKEVEAGVAAAFAMADGPGRLAVARSRRGKRVGELLLMDGLERSFTHSTQVGSFAVLVDAKEGAVGFYRRYGFLQLPDGNRMLLPMDTVRQMISGAD